MKYKVDELIGWRLDQAVAKACGYGYDSEKSSMVVHDVATGSRTTEEGCTIIQDGALRHFSPSTNWAQGGPIIDRERIGILPAVKSVKADTNYRRRTGWQCMDVPDGWEAGYEPSTRYEFDWYGSSAIGETPLITAMRAFVKSKFGDEVEL